MGRKRPKQKRPAVETVVDSWSEWPVITWIEKHSLAVTVLLIALASLRVVATYNVFNHTADEPAHIGAGMQWLDRGIYNYEYQHPPLARIAAALGPYLAGLHSQGRPQHTEEGVAILDSGNRYDRNLALARFGILPFFWIASMVVYFWARRYQGEQAALLAVFLFTFLPPILAHAGLATTDMALTAFTGASFLTALVWIEEPSLPNSAMFGASTGLAAVSKFSALPFLPVAMAAALLWYAISERPGMPALRAAAAKRALPFCLAVFTGALVIWMAYRCSFGPMPKQTVRIPAPEFFAGIGEVMWHNDVGHSAFLLGARSRLGFWYYFPVVLAVKTPLPFLALLFAGAGLCLRNPRLAPRGLWLPLTFSLGILLYALTSHINIGVRHILPVYIGFSIVAAAGGLHLLDRARQVRWARWVLGLLLFWTAATSLISHPDYIPYFNALAGSEPENIVVDSDLDWGQDIKRLGKRLAEVGAQQLSFLPPVEGATRGFPPMKPGFREIPDPGWNAVSLTILKMARLGLYNDHPEIQVWPERYRPTEKIGKGIWLYYFPPAR